MIFKRKKKKLENFNALGLINDIALPLTPFGEKITNSDVVLICIDRIASQCAKLQGRCIKRSEDGIITERNKSLSFLLKSKPNEYMTPYQFIYKVVSLLLLNDNAFVYPLYDRDTLELKALYPLNPIIVEPIVDKSETYYLKFYFESGESFILPKENVIHLRRFYTGNDIFGGSGSKSSHEALLKTLGINDALLQGVEKAVFSSFQIKGILKLNGLLKEEDRNKAVESFNRALEGSSKNKSSIVPMDLKSEYVPISLDPKLVDKDTLNFIQSKILDYFGVSLPVFSNSYNENEFNAFYETTIEPLAIQLSEAFSLGLLTDNELKNGTEIIFYSERLQYASWTTKVSAIEKLMSLGLMSINECRGLLGLEPIEGGNKRLQSLNFVDSDKANKYQIGEEEKEENLDDKGNKNSNFKPNK